eukprot:8068046-Ditylum_brightwellii.AAC.1
MNCELCHVVGSDEDDIDEQEEEENDTEQLQKVYTYSCRCGDEFEIVEEDIITMNGQPPSNDNGPKMRKGEGGNNELYVHSLVYFVQELKKEGKACVRMCDQNTK